MIKVVSWNVNSINTRLTTVLEFLAKYNPDVVLLQEIKCETNKFPGLEIQGLGYNIAVHGQKTYNGVAILSKAPIEDIKTTLIEYSDDQARYVECFTYIKGVGLRIGSVYVPNGQSVGSDKFLYKLRFLKTLNNHLKNLLQYEEAVIVGGDYNVAPDEIDVYDSKLLNGEIGFNLQERNAFREILNSGYNDSFRIKNPGLQEFSWWDYRGNSLVSNFGMRIDHILTSPEATDLIKAAGVYKEVRKLDKASDHAPIYLELHPPLIENL